MIKLTPITFDKFIRDLNSFQKDIVEIDLTQVNFIAPAVLTQLAALCHVLHGEKRQITIKFSPEIGTYAVRSGFVASVAHIAQIKPEIYIDQSAYKQVQGINPLLLEVTRIEDMRALPELFDQLVMVLMMELKYRKNDAYDIMCSISEVCENALDHNRGTAAFMAMQSYFTLEEKFLQIGISDYGVGLATTLNRNEKNPKMNSDFDAIHYAIRQGTSEYDDPTRGTGLHHLMEFTDKHYGTVQIHSGKGKIRQRKKKCDEWKGTAPYLPGVHVVLEFGEKKD